ncbi:hypothetical protein [Cognatishimia sp. MH4019]|uniref:hypothetical protein n=1 Tax=Cognatishimia sp. MH4019 TaxID=2854030 RepID=UPI001CD4D392|nr:hypothetical protein [Cognatishimia sp. MH4019]
MTRHLIDHPKTRGETARLKHFLRVEKADKPQGTTKTLQRRMRSGQSQARLRAFLRIARQA